jgi:signal peptidase II
VPRRGASYAQKGGLMTHTRFGLATYITVAISLIDQISKWWVINQIMRSEPRVVPVSQHFNIVLVENKGMIFGLLSRFDPHITRWFLLGVAAIILFLLFRWLWRTSSTPVAIGLGFIMGGAIGNVIDRLHYGFVVDFLDFYAYGYHWYAFNVADAAIDIGIAFMLLDSLRRSR